MSELTPFVAASDTIGRPASINMIPAPLASVATIPIRQRPSTPDLQSRPGKRVEMAMRHSVFKQ
jgi:hypothetical protein